MEIEKIKGWLGQESDHLNSILPFVTPEVKVQLTDVLEGINNVILYLEEGHIYCHTEPLA